MSVPQTTAVPESTAAPARVDMGNVLASNLARKAKSVDPPPSPSRKSG